MKRSYLLAAFVTLSLAALSMADDCPDGRCPLKQSMFVAAPAPTASQQATPQAVRVEWIEAKRKPLFPRIASLRAKQPIRRFAARVFWKC